MLDALLNLGRRFAEKRRADSERRQFEGRKPQRMTEAQRLEAMEEDSRRVRVLDQKRHAELDVIFQGDPDANADKGQRTLVVVDMQPHFLADYNAEERLTLLDSVADQIGAARRRGWHIIFLEFLPLATYGRTDPRLLALVDGYEDKFTCRGKHYRSGAGPIHEACRDLAFYDRAFQVCGIYSDQCVYETVRDLALNPPRPEVYVVPSACRSWAQVAGQEQHYDWLEFPRCENITLIAAPCAYVGHASAPAATGTDTTIGAHSAPPAPDLICP